MPLSHLHRIIAKQSSCYTIIVAISTTSPVAKAHLVKWSTNCALALLKGTKNPFVIMSAVEGKDVESHQSRKISWFTLIVNQGVLTPEIIEHKYSGAGTENEPYLVEWIPQDPRDPMHFPEWQKWSLTQVVAFITLTVTFVSSAYSSGIPEIMKGVGGVQEVNTLGISLFVAGFALGPFFFAPLFGQYNHFVWLIAVQIYA